jgi:hypothetical protein
MFARALPTIKPVLPFLRSCGGSEDRARRHNKGGGEMTETHAGN